MRKCNHPDVISIFPLVMHHISHWWCTDFCCLYVQKSYTIKRRKTITINEWVLGHRWQQQNFSVLGCLHFSPPDHYQTLLLTPLQSRKQGWHLAHLGHVSIQKVISKGFFTDLFIIQRAMLTHCPLRTCKHPEGNIKRLLLTYLESIGQSWHIAHLGTVIIQM